MHVMSLARPQQRAVGTEFDRLIVMVLRFMDDADALHDTMTQHRRSIPLVRACGGRNFSVSETNRSIPKRWKRYLPTSCPLTLLLFDEDVREAAASSSCLQRGDRSVQGARRADDELLRLHNEEEYQST